MNRRSFLKTTVAAAAALSFYRCSRKKTAPNVVFIFADDLGYGDISCYNPNSKINTPNIDRLAEKGMLFTDAHTSSAVCSPSRYSVLTGRYCWRSPLKSGVLSGHSGRLIEKNRLTVAQLFKDNGYRTACIGKWHLGWDWPLTDGSYHRDMMPLGGGNVLDNVDFSKPIENGPRSLGFDYNFCIPASLDIPPYVYLENDQVSAPVRSWSERVSDAERFQRAGDTADDFEHTDCLPTLTQKTVDFISNANMNQPFFIYFPLPAPHTPVLPTEPFVGKSKAGAYGDFVVMVDDVVGQVVQTLKDKGVFDNTLIIVTSDNGPERIAYPRIQDFDHYSMGDWRGLKRDNWEGGHRVPFVVSWPEKIKQARTCDALVGTVDFMATAAQLLDVELPENAAEDSAGFLPLLLGESTSTRQDIIYHSVRGEFAIRKGDWVYIDAPTGENSREPKWRKDALGAVAHNQPAELFNLKDDPVELRNLYAEFPDKVTELKALLEKYKINQKSVNL